MLKEGVNRLRGQVRIRVECAFPERVLNVCAARDLAFWDLEWESAEAFSCRLSRADCRVLRRCAEKLDCRITVLRREGAPYFLRRFRCRPALVTGLVGCVLALFLGSFFVWDFQVTGNETVPTERILRALEQQGVGLGSFGFSLDGEEIRNYVLLEIPELSWIAVNVSGCRAMVQVRERIIPPEPVNEKAPTNVVARRAGLVLEMRALNGVACVLKGASVAEGQLLISGVSDTGTFGARMLPGMGSVRARTWYSLTTKIPLTAVEKRYTGEKKTAVSLILGKRRVKFFANSSIEAGKYDKITKRTPWRLFGVPLPVTWVTETCRFYETQPVTRDRLQAERLGEQILTEQLAAAVSPYGAIRSTLCSARERNGVLEVTLTAECVEEIGKTVPIYTEETAGA
ncbi:MAG: sporulation protein YqfD [Ruminococcaceae bacterium]|nr:sporulation protein YqfD [Oscillospiraceae bacterium]